MNVRAKFRESLKSNRVIQIMGAHNGLGAKLIEKYGFDGVWASGFEISASYALPDANILTMTEFLEAAKQMTEATRLPVIADCDTGFGDLNNVSRLVREYEKIGVAAVCIEDKIFPKTNSYILGRQKLESIEVFCEKLYAAQCAKNDSNFVVIARIESFIAGEGLNEALKRAYAYEKAGADAILIHSKKNTPEEIFAFSNAWDGKVPIAVVPTSYPNVTLEELEKNKIKMVIYANQALRASVKAMEKVLYNLKKSGCLNTIDSDLVPMSDLFELQGMNEMILKENQIKDKISTMLSDY